MRHTRQLARDLRARAVRQHHVQQHRVGVKDRGLPKSRRRINRLADDLKPACASTRRASRRKLAWSSTINTCMATAPSSHAQTRGNP
jgi:hypothetical protein